MLHNSKKICIICKTEGFLELFILNENFSSAIADNFKMHEKIKCNEKAFI